MHATRLRGLWLAVIGALCLMSVSCSDAAPPPSEEGELATQGEALSMEVFKHPHHRRCGGIAGERCPEGDVCLFEPGTCHISDRQGICVDEPDHCPPVRRPVCGCDGTTYRNRCVALRAGASIDHAGRCRPDRCESNRDCPNSHHCVKRSCGDDGGVCRPRPAECEQVNMPVCGCDGETYRNRCLAARAGTGVAHPGACVTVCPDRRPEVGDHCDGELSCAYDEMCCPDDRCALTTKCHCDDGEWACERDPLVCPEPVDECPDDPFNVPADTVFAADLVCEYGKDCCCGECYPAIVCRVQRGSLVCTHTDQCLDPSCGGCPDVQPEQGDICRTTEKCHYGERCCPDGTCTPDTTCECDSNAWRCRDRPDVCTVRLCRDNEDCGDGVFCEKRTCDMDFGQCKQQPQGCPRHWDPVCGCDGKTYGNACGAHAAGMNIDHEGECKPRECPAEPPIGADDAARYPEGLRCEYGEECCCGECFPSLVCMATPDGWACYYTDACLGSGLGCGCKDNDDCEDLEYCAKDACEADRGRCQDRPLGCPDHVDPVCGCDGETYGNACEAAAVGVNVEHEGECKRECPAEPPISSASGDTFAPAGLRCEYGEECCCGECYPSLVCVSTPDGWACHNTDACLGAGLGCECKDNDDCEDREYCAKDGCEANHGRCHDRPEACIEIYDPVCGCDGETYSSGCVAASKGVNVEHKGVCKQECPAEPPLSSAAGGAEDAFAPYPSLRCEYGEECCCGECYPSLVCELTASGGWVCYNTDACEIPHCPCPDTQPEQGDRCEFPQVCEYDKECCPDGETCGATTSCRCDAGGWLCRDEPLDCGVVDECPEDPFNVPPGTVFADDLVCEYGEECCCGSCGPAVVCRVQRGGLMCMYTDRCLGAQFCECKDNSHCTDDQFCAEEVCGEGGTCAARPEACLTIWDPVCGCDGKTYSNGCSAAMAGVSVASKGECTTACRSDDQCRDDQFCQRKMGQCGAEGQCAAKPQGCDAEYAPVCGCDGTTYSNSCAAAAAGANVRRHGPCEHCGSIAGWTCAEGERCEYPPGQCHSADLIGKCVPAPDLCTADAPGVCGCDGLTYSNDCVRLRAGVQKDHDGPCELERCCDPAHEPGTNGLPWCFEGHTCCPDGTWRCNHGNGSPACGDPTTSADPAADAFAPIPEPGGEVCTKCCDPRGAPGASDAAGFVPIYICIEGATCCADGTWQCNRGDGTPSCEVLGQTCSCRDLPCDVDCPYGHKEDENGCPTCECKEQPRCCDPATQPGADGNPHCIEGATCCANGKWACNNYAGQPTCDVARACKACCDAADEPGCHHGATCCEDGTWACNSLDGSNGCAMVGDVCRDDTTR